MERIEIKNADVRIMRLPAMKVVSSTHEECAPVCDARMEAFVEWLKERNLLCVPGMRQGFMAYNESKRGFELIMSISESYTDTGIYETRILEEGLYAVTTANMDEIEEKHNMLMEWIKESKHFTEDTGRLTLGEVITPWDLGEKLGFEQQDIFVPVKLV